MWRSVFLVRGSLVVTPQPNYHPTRYFCRYSGIRHFRIMGLFDLIAGVFGYSKKEARIVVIGLDNSGKTTLINHIKPKKVKNHT